MRSYIEPIRLAFLVFPFIAFLITIPYLIYHYHKYGSVPLVRSIIIYTFVLYLINIYFLVILPLPSKQAVAMMKPRAPQLIPFQFVVNIMNKQSIVWNDFHSYIAFFKSSAVYTVVFNVFLTLPLGVYLRYYFQKKWYQVLIISFGVSLFFEITQLTGLYGIYPKAYRLFDVDDLMMNTLGGMIGCFISPLLTKFLPSRQKIDQVSYEKGKSVSIYRRAFAYFIDFFFCMLITLSLLFVFQASQLEIAYFIAVLSYFVILPCITSGYTVGKFVVQIRLVSLQEKYSFIYLFCRQLLLQIIINAPFIIHFILKLSVSFISVFISFILLIYYLKFIFQVIGAFLSKKPLLFYEELTKTQNVSTIAIKE